MKNLNFHSLHTIDKLATLRKLAKEVELEYYANQLQFQKFIDEIDDGYCYADHEMDERIAELNVILAKSDDLFTQMEVINDLVNETKSQLCN